jgi:hypothetical protein
MVKRLMSLGIQPKKSYVTNPNRTRREPRLLAGNIDEDGSVVVFADGRRAISLVGQRLEVEQFSRLVRRLVRRFRGGPTAHASIWKVRVSGFAAAALAEVLYTEASTALARNARTAARIISEYAGRDPDNRDRVAWPPIADLVVRVNASSLAAIGRELSVSTQSVRQRLITRGAVRCGSAWVAAQPRARKRRRTI